jgi:hypothetical protein
LETHYQQDHHHHRIANMPRSFQIPRALQLENVAVVDDERHQNPVEARDFVFASYLTAACGVSNDPPDAGVIVDLTVCNITRYRCSPSTSYIPTVVDVPISYDYQIRYNPDADFTRVLPFVEESILESLAAAMNLKRCPGTGTNRRKLRRSLQDDFTTTQQDRVVGVSLFPRDYRDERFDSCLPEVDGAEFLDSECQPIRGGLTVSLVLSAAEQEVLADIPKEDEEAIRSAVLDFISRNMGEDNYVVPGNIERLTFVGDRPEAVVEEQITKDDDGGLSSAGKGLLSTALPLFFIIMLLGLVLGKRRRKDGGDDHRQAELMPAIVVLPEEDEQNWHIRSASSSGKVNLSPGSLAFTDSLALEPQVIIQEQMSGVEVLGSGSPASSSNSPARASRSQRSPARSVEVEEEGKELRVEDFADYQLNMIAEAGSEDSLFDIDEEEEDLSEGSTSEYTPRRALQMT